MEQATTSYTITASITDGSIPTTISITVVTIPGSLETTFNSSGIVVHDGAAGLANGNDYSYGNAIQTDGKIVVAGSSVNASGNADMTIWRYNN